MNLRIKYHDNLKFMAFIMVICIHVVATYLYGGVPIKTFSGMFLNIINSISRVCIPIFFMVSGVFLYNKKEIEFKKFYINKFINIIVPFLLIATFTFVIENRYNLNFIVLKEFIKSILQQTYTFHFWYVYALIQILLLSPFLSKIVHSSSKEELIILIFILFLGTCFINSIDDLILLLKKSLHMELFPNIFGYIGYTFLGYYLANNDITKKQYNSILIIGFLSLIYTIGCTFYISDYLTFETFNKYNTVNVLLSSIAIFLLFKKIFNKQYFFTGFTKFTYFGYLVHMLFLNFFVYRFNLINPVTGFVSIVINVIMGVMCTATASLCFGYLYYVFDDKIKSITKYKQKN